MKQVVTTAIILSRVDYGEADRILTVLSPDHGKLSLLAKGVRRVKSKLAGGIELFSISSITFIRGRGSVDMLVSTKLITYYDNIVKNLDRTMTGYDFLKQLHRVTEDKPEAEYFALAEQVFEALNEQAIEVVVVRLWFMTQLLRLAGHTPNLRTSPTGLPLDPNTHYDFDFTHMAFVPHVRGKFMADHIKYLRLSFSGNQPRVLHQVRGGVELTRELTPLVRTMLRTFSLL